MRNRGLRAFKVSDLSRWSGLVLSAVILIVGLLGAIGGKNAHAAASNWHETDQTTARLISAKTALDGSQDLTLGLHFTMRPGWKIYWRSPGDAGFPPRPSWQASTNLENVEISWPVPLRFEVLGLQTLGYKDEVIFPVRMTVKDPAARTSIRARIPYLACDDICIPYEADLSLDLPAGDGDVTAFAHVISAYDAKVPGDPRRHGLQLTSDIQILDTPADDKASALLRIAATSDTAFDAPDLFLEGDALLSFSKPTVQMSEDRKSALLDVRVFGAEDLDKGLEGLEGSTVVATLVDGARSGERPLRLSKGAVLPSMAPSPTPQAPNTNTPLGLILLFAVLGGLILNLMPCVLPVLSIKVLGVMGHGGGNKGDVRLGFLATAGGIFAAFAVLAGGLIVLQTSGMHLGWGIQFQQPWFLAALAAIVTAFACNLWGWFEITLPERAGDAALKHSSHTGLSGHFLQGALATILATPCSAPFLGTAIGFALSRGPLEISLIFSGVAFGLALPYLAIAVFPGLATTLPRPGPWMTKMKVILGLALMATALWLLSVLLTSTGALATSVTAAFLVLLSLALFLRTRGIGLFKSAGMTVAAVLGFMAVIAVEMIPASSSMPTEVQADGLWQPFDEAAIPRLVAQGKTVFVDVTADWCITCQVNKKAVLDRGQAAALLADQNTVAMRADWTKPDMKIADFLSRFGRFGIPFNVVYGPQAPQGIPLPELLTQAGVSDAFREADPTNMLALR